MDHYKQQQSIAAHNRSIAIAKILLGDKYEESFKLEHNNSYNYLELKDYFKSDDEITLRLNHITVENILKGLK